MAEQWFTRITRARRAIPGRNADASTEAVRRYSQSAAELTLREPEQIGKFFDGFDLLPPGLVPAARWRPELPSQLPGVSRSTPAPVLAGVAALAPS